MHISIIHQLTSHTSAYVRIRQHTSAYVSVRTSSACAASLARIVPPSEECAITCSPDTSAYVSIRRIRLHTSAYVCIRLHTSASMRHHLLALKHDVELTYVCRRMQTYAEVCGITCSPSSMT